MVIKSTPPPKLLEKPLTPNKERHQFTTNPYTCYDNIENLYVQHVIPGRLYRELIRGEWDTDNPQL